MKTFKILLFSFCLLFLFLSPKLTYASDFATSALVNYDIEKDGITKVTYDITIENTTDASLSKGYVLSLTHVTPKDITASEEGIVLSPEIVANDVGTNIILNFQKPINGKGKKKRLTISFTANSLAQKSGSIWEVFIPKIAHEDDFQKYSVNFSVPKEFGDVAYVTPKRAESYEDGEKRIYHFDKDDILESGIGATFGSFQVFSFDLSYHLKNTSWKVSTQEIAIPPDTGTQKIYLEDITPEPRAIRIDEDGNWIAQFSLFPFQSIDPKVKGQAQLFASPRKLSADTKTSLDLNMQKTSFWQTDDPQIQELANELKTPENIYNYVVKTLSYNYEKVNGSGERLGATLALKSPENAICMEFTDLFIAIARAAHIPAREINGFAYSDNPKIQPLSLVSDILHSWPEYYDMTKEIWIPIDPTWAKTTGGQDFFETFDLRHIAFVIHGKSDTFPPPAGSYKLSDNSQKDVYVTLDTLHANTTPTIAVPFQSDTSFLDSKWKLYSALIISLLCLILGVLILLLIRKKK